MKIEEGLFPTNDRRKFIVDVYTDFDTLSSHADMVDYDIDSYHKVVLTIRSTGDIGLIEFIEGPVRLMDAIMETPGFSERLRTELTTVSGMYRLRFDEW